MKKPDEIKKGLECCSSEEMFCAPENPKCTYDCGDEVCIHNLMRDALAYIQQLEADNAQHARCIENLTEKLNATNEALPRWISVEERLPEHWHMDDKDVGETVTFFENERQLQAMTGLDHNGLWDAGFDLDDWDYGFVTVEKWPDPERMLGGNVTEYQWHIMNLCELRHVEYQGRHYYMRYHA